MGQVGQSHRAGTSLRTCCDVFPGGSDGNVDCGSPVEGLPLSSNSTFQSSNVQFCLSINLGFYWDEHNNYMGLFFWSFWDSEEVLCPVNLTVVYIDTISTPVVSCRSPRFVLLLWVSETVLILTLQRSVPSSSVPRTTFQRECNSVT